MNLQSLINAVRVVELTTPQEALALLSPLVSRIEAMSEHDCESAIGYLGLAEAALEEAGLVDRSGFALESHEAWSFEAAKERA
jgi:hypothetical protein